ncbi:MAG: polysaccharide deacetylase family protein [Elusimicrobiaceae bacterium]|nr:polysaccharide deacetylase family protein [Elusimicrobiaceae bacterium]
MKFSELSKKSALAAIIAVAAIAAGSAWRLARTHAGPADAAKAAVPRSGGPDSDFTRGYPEKAAAPDAGAAPPAGEFGRFYSDGKRQSGRFALTFDDGPGTTTPELLELLRRNNARATFFMLGSAVRRYPKYAAAVAGAGHLLGNHTFTHANFNKLPQPGREAAMAAEICETEAAVYAAAGQPPYFLRAPYGLSSQWIRELAAKKGYVLVNWSCGADWWFYPREQILKQYLDNLHSGAIFLLHDGGSSKRETTVWLVERILAEAKKRGLKPARLDELLDIDMRVLARERAKLSGCCSCGPEKRAGVLPAAL